jgi:hypothetical protein
MRNLIIYKGDCKELQSLNMKLIVLPVFILYVLIQQTFTTPQSDAPHGDIVSRLVKIGCKVLKIMRKQKSFFSW